MYYYRKKALAVLLAGSILLTGSGALATELEEIEGKQSEIQQTNELMQNQRYAIDLANQDLDFAFDALESLQVDMAALKEEITGLQAEIDELNESIAKNEAERTKLEQKLNDQIELFKKRLDVMYKNRNTGYVPVLLSSDNVDDFLSKLTTMKSVAEYDKSLIDEMKETKKQLDLVIIKLNGEKATLAVAMENLEIKEADLMDSISDQKDLIAVIQHNKNLAANELSRLEDTVHSLNAEIATLTEQYQERLRREEEERQRILAAEKAAAEEAARIAAEEEAARIAAEEAARNAAATVENVQNETSALVAETSQLSSVDTSSRNMAPEAGYEAFTGEVVYYNQREEPWGSASYGNGWLGTIAANGCGPTSMAMVLSSMLGQTVTPIEMANFATQNGHVMPGDGGSYWSLFPGAATSYGIKCTQSYSRSEIIDALSNGALVILSQNNALGNYWTYGGHFIVLTGITDSGNITVADPWSRGMSVRSHTQDQTFIPMKGAWIFTY